MRSSPHRICDVPIRQKYYVPFEGQRHNIRLMLLTFFNSAILCPFASVVPSWPKPSAFMHIDFCAISTMVSSEISRAPRRWDGATTLPPDYLPIRMANWRKWSRYLPNDLHRPAQFAMGTTTKPVSTTGVGSDKLQSYDRKKTFNPKCILFVLTVCLFRYQRGA
ncbi:hypothetical protein EDB19DRAFT_1386026 [Suillus lakei]|nr:hypothetical protein EDB19DRAFT_1386026 [Suillus lakei]